MAIARNGEFLLRIEDIDRSRARVEWENQIFDDLKWLGLCWPTPVMHQSQRMDTYGAALRLLWDQGMVYECTCNRRDILAALSAPQEGADVPTGPDGLIYPGTCRGIQGPQDCPMDSVLRLDCAAALNKIKTTAPEPLSFFEAGSGPDGETGYIEFNAKDIEATVGDIVLARRDMGTSYHLSVVLDDAAQGITHVVRGQDLFKATKIHVILQRLLGLPTPVYHHHRLIRDEDGKRLAKRDDARAIAKYRADGITPQDLKKLVGL